MRAEFLATAAFVVLVTTAGCAGVFTGGEGSAPTPSNDHTQDATTSSLQGADVWLSGTLVDATEGTVVLETSRTQVALNTTHGAFFRSDGAPQEWRSVDTWRHLAPGVNVCVSAHVHRTDLHVIKAFYNSTCTPLAEQ